MTKKKLSKKTGLPLGEYVSRSTYNKVAEENKRLLKNISLLVEEIHPLNKKYSSQLILIMNWRKKFKRDLILQDTIKEMLRRKPQSERL